METETKPKRERLCGGPFLLPETKLWIKAQAESKSLSAGEVIDQLVEFAKSQHVTPTPKV
jgi:hypothetical protein